MNANSSPIYTEVKCHLEIMNRLSAPTDIQLAVPFLSADLPEMAGRIPLAQKKSGLLLETNPAPTGYALFTPGMDVPAQERIRHSDRVMARWPVATVLGDSAGAADPESGYLPARSAGQI